MRKIILCAVAVFAVAISSLIVYAQAGRQPDDVGSPAFKAISSKTMTLKYGFRGASVYDTSTKKWVILEMTTITRGKVEGFVNQVNDNFALAAGLHQIAIYDFSLHKWVVREKVTPDDSTGELGNNFVLAVDSAKVKQLGGKFFEYTTKGGWVEK